MKGYKKKGVMLKRGGEILKNIKINFFFNLLCILTILELRFYRKTEKMFYCKTKKISDLNIFTLILFYLTFLREKKKHLIL